MKKEPRPKVSTIPTYIYLNSKYLLYFFFSIIFYIIIIIQNIKVVAFGYDKVGLDGAGGEQKKGGGHRIIKRKKVPRRKTAQQ